MAKIIKKSLPWFVILALIGLVAGVAFNFGKPQAGAEGKPAKVTVGNVLPVITVATVDSSACTTPINVGSGVTFTATATDVNGDTWKILVCKTAGTTGIACTGTQWCVSTSGVASGNPNSCTYTPVVTGDYNAGGWFAYACDSTGCTADANANSPFYVNRAPNFTVGSGGAANPGENAAFTTTSSDDDDTADGCAADQVKLFVCATEGATASGCSGTELCNAALGDDNRGCNYGVPIPTTHGADKDYYPYVFDTHSMAAGGDQQGVVDHYTVNDVAPTISSVSLHGGTLIVLNLKGSTTDVAAVSTDVYDSNGFGDITGATAVIYLTTKTDGCSANDNYCYQVATGNCVQSAGSGTTCTYTCTAAFKYYGDPTDTSSTWTADTWTAKMTASDQVGSGSQTSSTVELQTNTALSVTQTEINYDSVAAGTDTEAVNETTTVVNEGNSPIDNELYGTDMTFETNTIVVTQQKWNLTAFTYSSGGTTLKLEANKDTVNIVATKPTSTDITDDILWGIGIPEGKASGAYEGTNTFIAAIDADDWPGTP